MEDAKKKPEEVDVESKVDETTENNAKEWETPTLEDVSEKIMAQPYIRFT